MSSGPEHYAEAERLLDKAQGEDAGNHLERYFLSAAQVHATLALAAATAADRVVERNYEGQVIALGPAAGWTEATS